jgi:hypothetical protein
MKRLAYLFVCALVLASSAPSVASGAGSRSGAGVAASGFFFDCERLRPEYRRACVQILKALTPVGSIVATGRIDASNPAGATARLPFPATYRINVSGTWSNVPGNWLDAEYTSTPTGHQDGWDGLGADFGDTQVDGGFVEWGAFDAGHSYSYTGSFTRSVNLAVFVGTGGMKVPAWYADNSGSLTYSIAYVG